ncbi:unnamed protein product [Arctia plantaginis]|uniref:Peptidase M23 domain-containing protein n=1 Tax=Arctia plantaginis TaxID=874455 RepID=A0A8S1BPE1_ARCPL|nr:unnamed protein product [Arctia plantaginis]
MRLAALFALLTVAAASELTQVDHVRQKFYNLEQELWVNVTDPQWRDAGLGGDVELTKAFAAFNEHVESIPRIKRITLKSWLWTKVSEKLVIIDGFYKNFMEFVMRQASPASVPSPVRDWLDMAETVLMDPRASVAQAVRKLHGYLEHADMFRSVLQDEDAEVCDLQLSAHQLIFDMYNTIALTEIKGYAMMQFSWMLLRIYGRGNFTQEASLTRQRYAERTGQTATAARAALASAKRDLYKCEPSVYNADTFAEVTRLLQGYIENEVDMNPDNTCKENCGYYTLAQNYGCYKDQYCVKQSRCNGRIIDCQFVDSDMWVCPASHYSSRRYEYIEYENGRVLGKGGKCDLGTTKVDSWWRWLFWHCSYCMCLCDDASYNSHRYFSLRPSVSDIVRNKVVTGIRLVKVGRVFHLKIHQGTLVERGFVESSEEVQVKAFDPSNADVKDGVDYHKLTYERRAIDLDELDSPSGYVLTGVRFQMIGAHLHFEIRSTPFNYTTGKLWPEKSQWISNDNTEGSTKPRSRMQLHKPDLPTRGDKILKIDSTHDQYIEFTHSDFDADAAQSTVPFIDVQPVVPSKASNSKGATLNSGAGVYHRGAPGSGGFIAVKLLTYDYSQHVKAEPPPDELLKEDEGFTTEISNKVEAN